MPQCARCATPFNLETHHALGMTEVVPGGHRHRVVPPRLLVPGKTPALYGSIGGQAGRYVWDLGDSPGEQEKVR